ncbi:TlpA family protein disulfide reductase [Halobacteria archaeon AArc-dxtr1]|nr:TlpA family protein disulfide reductase [Halobacteria archaeon AArc-dxtr1]
MERRELLVGGAGLAALASGAAFAVTRRSGSTTNGDDEVAGDDENGEPNPPFELRTIDPDDDTVTVPDQEGVSVVNVTRSHCPTGEGQIETLSSVASDLREDGIEDVQLVTVADMSASPDEADFREWWDDTDGDWTLALDADDVVADYYRIEDLPTTVVIDREGSIHWRGEGSLGSGTVSTRIRELVESDES